MKRYILIALFVTSGILPLRSATLEQLSLDDLIAKSTWIVRAKVTDSWAAFSGRDIYTHYKIQVNERFKGTVAQTLDVVVPGGDVGGLHQEVSGSPVLNKGDEFVFFLWTSRSGMNWIMGLTQGLFAVPGSGDADPMATRAANRELMLDSQTGYPVKASAMAIRLSDLRSRITARLGKAGLAQ